LHQSRRAGLSVRSRRPLRPDRWGRSLRSRRPAPSRLIRTLLDDLAGEITDCAGEDEAVAMYAATRPDWVLMDIHIAGGDGLTATREIRRRDAAARIVIVTQFDEEELRRAARDAGAEAYVLKEDLLAVRRIVTAL
jgi:DNA-binding NarL/FixJ family response regulator